MLTFLQVPQQTNGYDCGAYVAYFARAALEVPRWVERLAVEALAFDGYGRPDNFRNEMRSRWGSPMQIEKLRFWMQHTLSEWVDDGFPSVQDLFLPLEYVWSSDTPTLPTEKCNS